MIRRLISQKKSRKYFFRLLFLGLFTVCIPLIFSLVVLYWLISQNMEQQINATAQQMLTQVQQRIDDRLQEAEQAMVSLLFDNQVVEAIYRTNFSSDNIALLELSRKLNLVKQTISRAHTVDLYLLRQQTLLTSEYGYLSGDKLWETHAFYHSLVPDNTPSWRHTTFPESLNGGMAGAVEFTSS